MYTNAKGMHSQNFGVGGKIYFLVAFCLKFTKLLKFSKLMFILNYLYIFIYDIYHNFLKYNTII